MSAGVGADGRHMVITADDFGLDEDSARVVAGLVVRGRVSAVSVLAVAPGVRQALSVLREVAAGSGESIHMGVHVATTSEEGWPGWAPLSVAGRAEMADANGVFPISGAESLSRATGAGMHAEMLAQVEHLEALGVEVSRLDSHSGTIYGLTGPSFVRQALEVCAEKGLSFRLPRNLGSWAPGAPDSVRAEHAAAVVSADACGVRLPEVVLTDPRPARAIRGYEDLRDYYVALLDHLPEGISELIVHPGADSALARERGGD